MVVCGATFLVAGYTVSDVESFGEREQIVRGEARLICWGTSVGLSWFAGFG